MKKPLALPKTSSKASSLIHWFEGLGEILIFTKNVFSRIFNKPIPTSEVIDQIWKISIEGLVIIAMAGFFVGAIMAVQFGMQLKEFGALGYLGGLATSATFREIGPLLIAFMLSAKVGAFTSAELGTMRVTEQIDAIRCLGADPMQEIVVPRYLGIIFSSFFLLVVGLLMSVFGGLGMAYFFAGVQPEEYLRHIPSIVNPFSIFSGLLKCGVFSLILASICTFKGYTASGGSKGVGRAVVATSVATMISIVVADWVTSFIGEILLEVVRGYRS